MENTQGTNGKTAGRILLTASRQGTTWWEEIPTGEMRVAVRDGKEVSLPVYETLTGELLGRFEINRKGKIDYFFQVAKDGTGEVLNVNEKFDLKVLVPYCNTGRRFTVDITPMEKKSIGGGKTKWDYEVGITPIAEGTR